MAHSSSPEVVLADFPTIIRLPVQWGDQDAFGHVNNAVPLRWFETSRIAYLEDNQLAHMMSGTGLVPIVASITCNYRRQVVYPDTIHVGSRTAELGRSSMTLRHAVFSESRGAIVVDGQTVVVFFDVQKQRPTRIPPEVREKMGDSLDGTVPSVDV
jgi:acyl-CoA thioester hydrolase